jgi:uncharacterized membrane protein YhdT
MTAAIHNSQLIIHNSLFSGVFMMKKGEPNQLLTRYALTGGAIGLYFGLFFRPMREANYAYALVLALLVAVLMSGLHLWRQRPSLSSLPAYFAITFIKAALALTMLEGRHIAYDWGGKTAVTVFTVIMGAATGLWFAYTQSRTASLRKK